MTKGGSFHKKFIIKTVGVIKLDYEIWLARKKYVYKFWNLNIETELKNNSLRAFTKTQNIIQNDGDFKDIHRKSKIVIHEIGASNESKLQGTLLIWIFVSVVLVMNFYHKRLTVASTNTVEWNSIGIS